jgi:osmotically inducible protein OsmC
MTVAERRARVRWQGELRTGEGTIEPGSGAFGPLAVRFPARLESESDTTSPEELIAAAHATCYVMVLANVLSSNGFPAEDLEVTAVCRLNRTEDGLKIEGVELQPQARIARIDASQFDDFARKAEQRCPVSNALRANVNITVEPRLL